MPRKARIDAPGALHHIIIRGIERKAIFKDSADRQNFFERSDQIISETETGCYAWGLRGRSSNLRFAKFNLSHKCGTFLVAVSISKKKTKK